MSSYDRIKRISDIAVAGLTILLTAPVQAVVAAMIRRKLGPPILFRQVRPGLNGRPFTLVKFRTMLDSEEPVSPDSDVVRLTPLGIWLRSTSLDELPSLWNVLRGDMSVVGPRPLLMSYLDLYTPAQSRRHGVRPGITGLAQIRGRNALTWEEKFEADIEYVENRSISMDIRIMAATVTAVLRRKGINAADAATMPEFVGSNERRRIRCHDA